jgi:hypothetical protein
MWRLCFGACFASRGVHGCGRFDDAAMAWAAAAAVALACAAPVCRAPWRQPEAESRTVGRSERPTMPTAGSVGRLERRRWAADAQRRQRRLGKRGNTDIEASGDALGDSPEGSSGIVGVQRLWRFGYCCMRPAWQRAAGSRCRWRALAAMGAARGAACPGARAHVGSEAAGRAARPGS